MTRKKLSAPAHLTKSVLKHLSELPLHELFGQVYSHHYWGAEAGKEFFSGTGSHDEAFVEPYIKAVTGFLVDLENKPVMVDLGCGDFHIGLQLSQFSRRYHACDIVPELVEKLRAASRLDNVVFHCLDASTENLPDGEVLIVRQVLQHLSNAVIQRIIQQFVRYRYVIVTEHLPLVEFEANLDKPNGPDSRLRWHSGVDVLLPPFSVNLMQSETLTVSEDEGMPGTGLVTTLLKMH